MTELCWLDERILKGVQWVLLLLTEWLSVSQRKVEIGLIVAWTCARAVEIGLYHSRWRGLGLIGLVLMFAIFIGRIQQPAAVRSALVHMPVEIFSRLFFLGLVSLNGLVQLIPPVRKKDLLDVLASLLFYVLWMVTSLPTQGKPGRRRKMALEKLKELFGGWLPEPAGAGA
jgi:hypothetical protein